MKSHLLSLAQSEFVQFNYSVRKLRCIENNAIADEMPNLWNQVIVILYY